MKTVEEVKKYAMKHYNDGLDVVIECWEDKDIQKKIDDGTIIEVLKQIQSVRNDEIAAAKYFSGEYYTPSSTSGDCSPSNPWDAPGMSVRDFI